MVIKCLWNYKSDIMTLIENWKWWRSVCHPSSVKGFFAQMSKWSLDIFSGCVVGVYYLYYLYRFRVLINTYSIFELGIKVPIISTYSAFIIWKER